MMRFVTVGVFLLLFGCGLRAAPSQEVPPMLLVYTPDASHGGFTGEVRAEGQIWRLKPNDYAAGFLPFGARGAVSAIPTGGSGKAAEFLLDQLSYGQKRFIQITIVAGRVTIEEIRPGGSVCVPRGLHNAGTFRDRDVNSIYSGAECEAVHH